MIPTITSITIEQLDSGENFTSPESPLSYAGSVINNITKITVITPFHSNSNTLTSPTITVQTGENNENNVEITPSYNSSTPLSDVYTQVAKISFILKGAVLGPDGSATINITVNEEGKPDVLCEPLRKTKIIVQSTDAQ